LLYQEGLWKKSGHAEHYRKNMFRVDDHSLKPMNCPAHFMIFKSDLKSGSKLPLALKEYGLVHRKEAHGAIQPPFRMNSFTQDDCHILCR
jgi:threonyl-tRNA synthetase